MMLKLGHKASTLFSNETLEKLGMIQLPLMYCVVLLLSTTDFLLSGEIQISSFPPFTKFVGSSKLSPSF